MLVHCAFDDIDKATKALAANGNGRISQERGAKYYKQNYIIMCDIGGVGRWYLASTSPAMHAHHMTVCHAISRTMSAKRLCPDVRF